VLRLDKEALAIEVKDSFWPHFFASKLVIKYVHGTMAFSVSCPDDQTQIIFVYPEEGTADLPTIDELMHLFPCDNSGEKLPDVRKLPISQKSLRNITGVYLQKKKLGDRTVFVLYPTWDPPARLNQSDGVLNAADFNLPASEMQKILRESADHAVIALQLVTIREYGFIRIFTLLRLDSVVRLSDKITLICRKDGQLDPQVQQLN